MTTGFRSDIATATTAAPVASLDRFADYLIDGYWRAGGNIAHKFDTGSDGTITADITGLTSAGQQLARWAFEAWEQVADIRFELVSGGADITLDDARSGATTSTSWYSSGPDAGDTISARINISTDWIELYGTRIGDYAFSTFLHEIGHALGLGHPGHYNSSASYSDAVFANDSVQWSVMSYFDQDQNPTVTASDATPITPMIADILAIQKLYGASDVTRGATVWGANSDLGGPLGRVFDSLADGRGGAVATEKPLALTIYDAGGIDTINLRFSPTDDRISLDQGSFSDVGGLIGNLGIARGTVIENVIAGSGNDTILGNAADNMVRGGDGHDVIRGGGGNDLLMGGAGDDRIQGGYGNDQIYASDGDDTLYGERGDDILGAADGDDLLAGGSGDDMLWTGAGDDRAFGGSGNDAVGGGFGNDLAILGWGDDTVYGGAGDDSLRGEAGDDLLWGGWGADTLAGNVGDDTLKAGGDDDILKGCAGDDLLTGGFGADSFVFGAGDGADTISDFDSFEGDRLQLDAGLWGGGMGALQLIESFATTHEWGTLIDFGDDTLALADFSSLTALAGAIDIV